MNLEDLFAVYNELTPETSKNVKRKKQAVDFYSPLSQIDRVREIIKPDVQEDSSATEERKEVINPVFSWSFNQNLQEEIPLIVPYREGAASSKSSKDLVQYLKDKEKFVSTVYQDSGGVSTIGYGFTDPELIKRGQITEEEASEILLKDIEDRKKQLSKQIKTWDQLNKNQQDALISYGFNVGVGNWAKTQPKLLAALNEGRFNEASKYMNVVKDKKGQVLAGLVKRRREEQEWFNS